MIKFKKNIVESNDNKPLSGSMTPQLKGGVCGIKCGYGSGCGVWCNGSQGKWCGTGCHNN